MSSLSVRAFAGVALLVFATALFSLSLRAQNAEAALASAAAPGQPMVEFTTLNVTCTTLSSVTPSYAKIVDIGTFNVDAAGSIVDVTFNGRIYVGGFTAGTGAVFELRVDDQATASGRARANLRTAQAGDSGVQASIKGIFPSLSTGNHTVSMWVRTSSGGAATQAMVDPGCWSTDHVVVAEYRPFGGAFLPLVQQ